MSAPSTIACPHCSTALVSANCPVGLSVLCAQCQTPFVLGLPGQKPKAQQPPYSRKAIYCLVLALCGSWLGCLSSVPAVILGLLAMREIKRKKLRGQSLAIAGSVIGVMLSIACPFAIAFGVQIYRGIELASQHTASSDPQVIARLMEQLPKPTLPPGVEPRFCCELPGFGVRYIGATNAEQSVLIVWGESNFHDLLANPLLSQFELLVTSEVPNPVPANAGSLFGDLVVTRRFLRIEASQEAPCTLLDKPATLRHDRGIDAATNLPSHRYTAVGSREGKHFGVLIYSADPATMAPAGAQSPPVWLSEQQVRELIEGIRK